MKKKRQASNTTRRTIATKKNNEQNKENPSHFATIRNGQNKKKKLFVFFCHSHVASASGFLRHCQFFLCVRVSIVGAP